MKSPVRLGEYHLPSVQSFGGLSHKIMCYKTAGSIGMVSLSLVFYSIYNVAIAYMSRPDLKLTESCM